MAGRRAGLRVRAGAARRTGEHRSAARRPESRACAMNEIVVFSHVRWNSVCRRPQQILTRLARSWRVLFIEEPLYSTGDPRAALCAPQTGVTVMTPHTPITAPGFHDAQIPVLQKLVGQALSREGFADYGAWLYTPMALPLLRSLRRGSSSTIASRSRAHRSPRRASSCNARTR